MSTIRYSYVSSEGHEKNARWVGDYRAAVRAGVEALGAVLEDGQYVYHDGPTESWWAVSEYFLATLGAGILDGRPFSALYSRWCAETDAEEA